jgi:HEAT repeat protein
LLLLRPDEIQPMSNAPRPADNLQTGPPSASLSGGDLLPPVEPPSAVFILQLFVVPALIVLVIVGVWLSFSWLVHRDQPRDLIQGLESSRVARWQRASELADMLRNERYEDFRSDSSTALQLTDILNREIDGGGEKGGMDDEAITLRYFLCRALGEFRVPGVLDSLLKAATTNRDPREQIVRQGAVEAIAVLTYNLRQLDPPQELNSEQLDRTLAQLANDKDNSIRSVTAYTLGRIGTPASLAQLEILVDDPDADTRYNAAVALAHHGNAKAVETLAEMLDYTETSGVRDEPDPRDRISKRTLIISNAMDAVRELARQNPQADLSEVTAALDRLTHANVADLQQSLANPGRAIAAATQLREELRQHD